MVECTIKLFSFYIVVVCFQTSVFNFTWNEIGPGIKFQVLHVLGMNENAIFKKKKKPTSFLKMAKSWGQNLSEQ